MKYYNKLFLKSELFYKKYYLPFISLTEYIVRENYFRELGEHEKATGIVKQEYISHCKDYFKPNIFYYEDLSKYILNQNGEFKPLDEYIFFKLRYYGTKFLNVANEARNFFEEERNRFKKNNYTEAIRTLSEFKFHDADAIFKYKDNVLRIIYRPGCFERIYEFNGIKNWEEKEFMKRNPTLLIEELYEESQGIFVYNTLWYHEDMEGRNYSELSIKFTDLVQVK